MTDTVIQIRGNIPVGQRSFGPVAIPANIVEAGLIFDKTTWTDASIKLSVSATLVIDGLTIPIGGFVDEPGGGAAVWFVRSIPFGTTRTISATVTVTGGTINTQVSVRLWTAAEGKAF